MPITIQQAKEKFTYSKLIEHNQEAMYSAEIYVFCRDLGLSDDYPVNNITQGHLDKWVEIMQKRNIKPTSINHYLRCIRVFLYWCMDHNMLKPFKVHCVSQRSDTIKFYSEDDIRRLLETPGKRFIDNRTYAIIAFILATGARASTIINIKQEDINWKDGEVYYRHLKNKKNAIIPLPKTVLGILNDFLTTWDMKCEWLFPDQYGQQLTVGALRQSINRYCIRKGVQPRSIHSFRHTFARMFIKNGGDAFVLQKYLTHSSLDVTQHYVALFKDDLRASMNSFIPIDKCLPQRKSLIQRRFK